MSGIAVFETVISILFSCSEILVRQEDLIQFKMGKNHVWCVGYVGIENEYVKMLV